MSDQAAAPAPAPAEAAKAALQAQNQKVCVTSLISLSDPAKNAQQVVDILRDMAMEAIQDDGTHLVQSFQAGPTVEAISSAGAEYNLVVTMEFATDEARTKLSEQNDTYAAAVREVESYSKKPIVTLVWKDLASGSFIRLN